MVMTEKAWYGSQAHFKSEMSYAEYLKAMKIKKSIQEKIKKQKSGGISTPSFQDLMKM